MSSWQRLGRFVVVSVLAFAGFFFVWASTAQAASGQVGITATSTPPQPSGAPSNYLVNFTCSATEVESCGDNAMITLPIDVAPVGPPVPPLTDWEFTVSSATPGLVTGWSLVGGEIVVELNEALIEPGQSMTLNLSVTPPNGYTPDGTSWEITPTYESTSIPEATAPVPAVGEAEATADLRVSKNTNDGGSIYVTGNQVIYNITASCNPGFPFGSLYLDDAELVDTLPPDVIFVSATPAPSSVPAPPGSSGGQVTWDLTNPTGMPPGCIENPGGTANYQIVAQIPNTVPDETVLHNEVTLSGMPIGAVDELSTTASKDITAIDVPPVDPGEFLGKGSQGPLEIEGLGFKGTYPGHWIQPVDTTPSQNPGTTEGRYTVTVTYPASRAYTTDLVDPVPCLDNQTGVKYSSLPVTGDVNGSASAPVCATPAFHPTVIRVASASMPQAAAANWNIQLILTNGSVVSVPVSTLSGTSAYFTVPSGNIGNVAAVRLPPEANLTDRTMTMDVWGYADSATQGGDIIEDIAAASAYPIGDTDPARTSRHAAELYIEPNSLQLAVHKSFGGYRSGPGGTTPLNIVGGVAIPLAFNLPGPIVLADLLPADMEWSNPPGGGTATFSLSQGLNTVGSITGDVEYIDDYEGTGRDLVRVSFNPSDFPGSGYFRLTPPSNFILVSVPQGANTYVNTADVFASGSGRSTSPACGAAQGTDVSNFESEDPLDLDGDGETAQNYCSFNATLTTPGTPGPSFAVTKRVQGELDPVSKGPGGVAETTNGGTGEYTINWRNTGTDDLDDPVAYDILPYVGDTGVSGGQASVPRGSQFQVTFDSITLLDPGVSVEYSDSVNPCRPEVYPAAPGCVNDWTTTPDDPTDVRSLKFTGSGTYETADSFEVRFKIKLPSGEVNTIAWNSTAATADFDGSLLLPAEPPKVGITAPAEPITPTLATQVASDDRSPGDELTDTIVIGNADDINVTVSWTLYGPVSVGDAADCDEASWAGAPVVDQGTMEVPGTGSYDTDPTELTELGCYGYAVTIDSPGFSDPVTSPVGSVNETAIIRVLQPTINTMISSARTVPGGSVTDQISITGTEGRSGTIEWSLVGPVEMTDEWNCDGIDWTGAATIDQGAIATDGDGQYTTPSTTVTDSGCYGYIASIGGDQIGGSANSPAGSPNEVVLVRSDPGNLQVTKKAGRQKVQVGSKVRYTIIVRNNGSGPVPDVKLIDKPARAMRFVSANPSQGTCDAKFPLTCELGTINAGRKVTITVMAIPLVTGDIENTATASTPDPEVDPGRDREEITGEVTLNVLKKANKATVAPGGRIGYRIKVTNPSPAIARNVRVCDRPPAGLEVIRTAPKANLINGAWCWRIKKVDPRSSVLLRVYARAIDGVSGRLANVAWVEGQDIRTKKDRAAVKVVRPRPPRSGGVTG